MEINKRTYINNEETRKLIDYFDKISIKKKRERQIIYTYHSEADFRLIKTKDYITLDLKNNKKEETVYIHKKYEESMINILTYIGSYVAVKRFRTRYMYYYDNMYITIDENLKYGNVFRISYDNENKEAINKIEYIYNLFNIKSSSMDKFEELYSKYRNSWADLTNSINEEEFLNEKIN